jgi:hypothetical protein
MRNVMFSTVHGCALSLALLGIVGCALDGSDPGSASDQVASDQVTEVTEHFDSERAAAIAKAKMASIDTATAITPESAACGRAGNTSSNVRTNDAAFTGAANQRSGSSTGCVAVGVLQPTDDALYFCFTCVPSSTCTETWTYNQNLRTGVRGWTRDDLLRGDGSFTFCGF